MPREATNSTWHRSATMRAATTSDSVLSILTADKQGSWAEGPMPVHPR